MSIDHLLTKPCYQDLFGCTVNVVYHNFDYMMGFYCPESGHNFDIINMHCYYARSHDVTISCESD